MIDQLSMIALRTTSFLAAPPTPPPGKGAEWGKAAPIGLLVILLLCVGVWLLLRSMNKHLRKVREFGDREQAERNAAAGVSDEPAGTGDDHPATATATVGAPEDAGPSADGPPPATDPPR